MKVLKYLSVLTGSETLEELWAAHTEKMAEYGFDRLLYGFTRYRTAHSLGDPDDFLVLTNHPRAYIDEFLEKKHYFHAPMVRWCLKNDGPCSWSVLRTMQNENALSAEAQDVLEFNRRHFVRAGYTISFRSSSTRSKGAISLTVAADMDQAEVDAIWEKDGADLQLMNEVAHLKIMTLPPFPAARTLTQRQREVLEWVGDGKTMQDIAMVMGVSVATVEKHLRLAREALGVETTAQAVLKAAFSNQIFIVDAKA